MDERTSRAARSRLPTRLLVTGQPYWSRQLAAQILRHTRDIDVSLARSPLALPLEVARVHPQAVLIVGFRPGAATVRGRAFDAITRVVRMVRPSATIARYWIGTDVEHAAQDYAADRLTGAFESSRRLDAHIAGAPWLVAELDAVGIRASYVANPAELPWASEPPELPSRFRALAYVADRRFDFYGGPTILEAARCLPGVDFDIVGCEAPADTAIPRNVNFLGWRSDMDQLMLRSSVVIRLARHDGMSVVVREALANARHVIWTYQLPSVHAVPSDSPEAVSGALAELAASHAAGTLRPNELGWRYARAEFEPGDLVRRLVARMLA